ncbi:MAG TPA: cytochrome P460 family protein [Bryobacteraceae bacterium]|nr:cytochrome P460 family protein [Bryobacteraceae bacterium]
MKGFCGLAAALLLITCARYGRAQEYTKAGDLVLPKDLRQWTFLTSGIGMGYPEEGPPGRPVFTNVFAEPSALKGFLKQGSWPDRTILLIEVRGAATAPALNEGARFQTDVLAYEAHVKDARRGGWLFYGFPKGAQTGKVFAKTAKCYSCHEQRGAVDTTFVQYYPTLIETAKKKGTYKQTGE